MNLNIGKALDRLKKLTSEQKKIIYISVIMALFLFFFWAFVYNPQSKKFAAIKRELTETEQQIAQIMSIASGRNLADAVGELNKNLVQVTSMLPAEETTVISSLSQDARRLRIEVKNIIPSGRQVLENKVSGYVIEELPISMSLICEYRVLGEYLNILRNKFPVLVRVKQLYIKGKGEGTPNLDISLQLVTYLAKPK